MLSNLLSTRSSRHQLGFGKRLKSRFHVLVVVTQKVGGLRSQIRLFSVRSFMCGAPASSGKHYQRRLGAGSTIHRHFQKWVKQNIFKKLWREGLHISDEEIGIDWE